MAYVTRTRCSLLSRLEARVATEPFSEKLILNGARLSSSTMKCPLPGFASIVTDEPVKRNSALVPGYENAGDLGLRQEMRPL